MDCTTCLFFINLLHNYDSDNGYESGYVCCCTGIAMQIDNIEQRKDCSNYIENDLVF